MMNITQYFSSFPYVSFIQPEDEHLLWLYGVYVQKTEYYQYVASIQLEEKILIFYAHHFDFSNRSVIIEYTMWSYYPSWRGYVDLTTHIRECNHCQSHAHYIPPKNMHLGPVYGNFSIHSTRGVYVLFKSLL
jgi:hypothetical protein